jgi:hypothetical protein
MKKFFSLVAIATMMLGFASCSNDDGLGPNNNSVQTSKYGKNVMAWNITQDGFTRGTATTAANFLSRINNFQVLGYYSDGSGKYVGAAATPAAGIIIDGDGAGNWDYNDPTQLQYWPSGNLDFQAITPATDASITLVNTVDETTPGEVYPRLTADVVVPSTVADQKDIMFASATALNNAASGNPVGLTFKHALSQVVFSGRVAKPTITAVVDEISVCNVYNAGNVGYRAALTTLGAATSGTATHNFSVGLIEGADAAATTAARTMTSTDAQNLTNGNGALMMIPQTQTAWTHEAPEKAIADATGSYLKVKCKVQDNNSGTWLIGAASGADEFEYVYIPFDLTTINWELGKKYTYTLVFGNGSGGYDEDGDPLTNMIPITYTVTAADDWTAVDGGSVEF